jgi:hypothetical protein
MVLIGQTEGRKRDERGGRETLLRRSKDLITAPQELMDMDII